VGSCGEVGGSLSPAPRGCSSEAEPQPSKLMTRVRFPSPALAAPPLSFGSSRRVIRSRRGFLPGEPTPTRHPAMGPRDTDPRERWQAEAAVRRPQSERSSVQHSGRAESDGRGDIGARPRLVALSERSNVRTVGRRHAGPGERPLPTADCRRVLSGRRRADVRVLGTRATHRGSDAVPAICLVAGRCGRDLFRRRGAAQRGWRCADASSTGAEFEGQSAARPDSPSRAGRSSR
jgi:hypothetical protein